MFSNLLSKKIINLIYLVFLSIVLSYLKQKDKFNDGKYYDYYCNDDDDDDDDDDDYDDDDDDVDKDYKTKQRRLKYNKNVTVIYFPIIIFFSL